MWNDSVVEETRKLREEYSVKLNYSVHAIAEDRRQWERQGFPMAADPDKVVFNPGIPGGLFSNSSGKGENGSEPFSSNIHVKREEGCHDQLA